MRQSTLSARGMLWAAASILPTALGHSWPEQTFRIGPNGAFASEPGFARAYVARGQKPENEIVWLLPPNGGDKKYTPDLKLVKESVRKLDDTSYSATQPMLKVAPGDFVAIQYTENGHVSRPDDANPTKPINRGTVYVYGTTENDLTDVNLMDVHLQWTADGSGGNGKGRLLATRHYDDGQCHEAMAPTDPEGIVRFRKQKNGVDALPCQTDVQIPSDLKAGDVLTVIWVWDWPTLKSRGIQAPPASFESSLVETPEMYTGVVDYAIVDACDEALGNVKGPGCNGGDVSNKIAYDASLAAVGRAIRPHLENQFLVKVPQAGGSNAESPEVIGVPFSMLIGNENPTLPIPEDQLEIAYNAIGTASGGAPAEAAPPAESAAPPAMSSADAGVFTEIVNRAAVTTLVTRTRTRRAAVPTVTGFLPA